MSDVEDIQGKRYPGFGRCIFCNSDGGADGLRDEHIIPKALGGKAVIEAASCKRCEAITSYIDGYLGRHIFQEYRAHTGAPTRRPKERPSEFPARVIVDGVEEMRHIKVPDHPYFIGMPVWGLPSLLAGTPPSERFEHSKAHVYEYIPDNIRATLAVPDDVSLQVRGTGTINHSVFARAIAKIAYCHSVLRYGLDGFRRLVLPQVILGMYPYPSQFVGCELDDPPPPAPKGQLHIINFEAHSYERMKVMVVSVRLFAHSGTDASGFPIYRVVTGAYK